MKFTAQFNIKVTTDKISDFIRGTNEDREKNDKVRLKEFKDLLSNEGASIFVDFIQEGNDDGDVQGFLEFVLAATDM